MNTAITTKMKIHKPASDVFEAIVDPVKIGGYWFSSGMMSIKMSVQRCGIAA